MTFIFTFQQKRRNFEDIPAVLFPLQLQQMVTDAFKQQRSTMKYHKIDPYVYFKSSGVKWNLNLSNFEIKKNKRGIKEVI